MPQTQRPGDDIIELPLDQLMVAPMNRSAVVNGQPVADDTIELPLDQLQVVQPAPATWSDQLGLRPLGWNPLSWGRIPVDAAEGVAALPAQMIVGGGDTIMRALGAPDTALVGQRPDVQQATRVPDSVAGAVAYGTAAIAPVVAGLVTAPVPTIASLLAGTAAGEVARPVARTAATMAGAPPSQAAAIGDLASFGVGTMAGNKAASVASRRAPSLQILRPTTNQKMADAIAWGEAHGVPYDAAAATDGEFALNVEKKLRGTLGGSAPMSAYDRAVAEGLEQAGGRLATRANAPSRGIPGQPQTNVTSGEAVTRQLEDRMALLDQLADRNYDRIRQIEARQQQLIAQQGGVQAPPTSRWAFTKAPLAVDIAQFKRDIAPLYAELAQQAQLAPNTMMGKTAQVYVWLDRIMNAPDLAPLTTVDKALSNLKALTRGAPLPSLTTDTQRAASIAAKTLDAQVVEAARRGGVEAELLNGRKAVVMKHQIADVWEALRAEPAQAVQQLTARRDTQITLLRQVARVAPRQVKGIARAWLDNAMQKATAEGSFSRADGLWADWQALGPETKQVLFGPQMTRELDHFFLLAKQLTKNANPSGTANTLHALNVTQVLAYAPAKVLAKVMTTPSGIRMLTRVMKLSSSGSVSARANALAQLQRVIAESSATEE